jgi:hypothetical protein
MRPVLACVAAVALVLSACGSDGSAGPTPVTPGQTNTTGTVTSPSSEQALALYWVGDTARGPRLFREFHRVPVASGESGAIEAALTALFATTPDDPDYSSLWPSNSRLLGVEVSGATATIDISFPRPSWGAEAEQRAVDQLVWTATAAETAITGVRIEVDGSSVETLAGHVDLTVDLSRQASYEVLAPIWITSHSDGDVVQAGDSVVLEGVATTFEANVLYEVLKGSTVVQSGFTTAEEAAPARAPWSVTLAALAPGDYVLRAMEFSAQDGSLVVEDTKRITVR